MDGSGEPSYSLEISAGSLSRGLSSAVNPKFETRNPKQIRSSKFETSPVSFEFGISDLFRISDFEFRILASGSPLRRRHVQESSFGLAQIDELRFGGDGDAFVAGGVAGTRPQEDLIRQA